MRWESEDFRASALKGRVKSSQSAKHAEMEWLGELSMVGRVGRVFTSSPNNFPLRPLLAWKYGAFPVGAAQRSVSHTSRPLAFTTLMACETLRHSTKSDRIRIES